MKTLLILLLTLSVALAVDSPNGLYSTTTTVGEFNVRSMVLKKGSKIIFSVGSGYGGFQDIQWSPDSKYLAVVDHGIKTMMILDVYRVDGESVTKVDLPDYRLNILGRYQLFEGGRYWFDKTLKWEAPSKLLFETTGSLKDGSSNPTDDPDNWYSFEVGISFNDLRAVLLSVKKTKQAQQVVAPDR
ncbi:hypothetical protein HW115_19355 [Verrucomicrobiaceae bacterium N1E253]|uniref:Uncharacterized protein n=1 Tax=Oceaniferula marina TaxID=2748318 RepID=A0A851GRN7_9BACT|nr:hypothetical protein [Oceaniferula marina]NWK57785.1 hypothetical protein [Oceaniferula marina]